MNVLLWLKGVLAPEVSPEMDQEMDRGNVESICYVSLAALILESMAAIVYMSTHSLSEPRVITSLTSVLFCCAFCLVGYLVARHFMREGHYDHRRVAVFKVVYFVVMSLWGVAASARHYAAGDQMLTFFIVELMMACFFVFKPWACGLLMGGACSALYAVLLHIDGAARISASNFLLFAVMATTGMSAHFHLQKLAAQRSTELRYVGLHDGLTGLYNRQALDEDAEALCGQKLAVYMADVNCFKELNDRCGHLVGDQVLREVANKLESIWPNTRTYRFGGDEFLIIDDCLDVLDDAASQHSFVYDMGTTNGCPLSLSVGCAVGTPCDKEDLFALISEADRELYRSKERAHEMMRHKESLGKMC